MIDDFDSLSRFFEDNTHEFGDTDLLAGGIVSSNIDDLFSFLDVLEQCTAPDHHQLQAVPLDEAVFCPGMGVEDDTKRILVSQNSVSSSTTRKDADKINHEYFEANNPPVSSTSTTGCNKKRKISSSSSVLIMNTMEEVVTDVQQQQQQQRTTVHVTVERNRRKQMNEHLSVLRSLMPSFYVKRGDQASIIGGVVDYIKEMQQVLQSLEAKKQRKLYSEILSPKPSSSNILSPRKPPLSPRVLSLPPSPRTPNQTSPCKPRMHQAVHAGAGAGASYLSTVPSIPAASTLSHEHSCPSAASSSILENAIVKDNLAANSKSSVADVEVKFSGPNVLLKTISARIPGQVSKIITALEASSLEILHLSINVIDTTMINSFTIKIGIECKLSAEELAHEIQQTFC